MSPNEWLIHLAHPGGTTWVRFHGTRAEAAQKAASYIGKPASWNCTKEPHEPNLWDTYTLAELEVVEESVATLRQEER